MIIDRGRLFCVISFFILKLLTCHFIKIYTTYNYVFHSLGYTATQLIIIVTNLDRLPIYLEYEFSKTIRTVCWTSEAFLWITVYFMNATYRILVLKTSTTTSERDQTILMQWKSRHWCFKGYVLFKERCIFFFFFFLFFHEQIKVFISYCNLAT